MKSVLEDVPIKKGSSFRIINDLYLNDFYYWHFHPEYELVYINAKDGSHLIGAHKSEYSNGDLAFIGPYIPHLNFDYGQEKRNYEITVLHIEKDFLVNGKFKNPEMNKIRKLLSDSRFGISFHDNKKSIGIKLRDLNKYSGFSLFIKVLELLGDLADQKDYQLLHTEPYENRFFQKEHMRLQSVIGFIEQNYHRKVNLEEVAKLTNYSEAAFCRYFKKWTKRSFTSFINNYRIERAKELLKSEKNISEIAYDVGFESLSYFNRVFKKITGTGPTAFKKANFK